MYKWNFNVIIPYIEPLFEGLLLTVWISLVSIIIGTILGIILVIARKSQTTIVRLPAILFIEVFLAAPVLVLLVWTYYCLPLLINVRLSGFATVVLVFSLSLSAFIAETLRSGIDAIPEGQIDAAASLQLSKIQIYRYIIFPQALRLMLPALLTQYLTLIKLSTLASVIAVYELLHTANNIVSRVYRPLEVYTVVALMFIAFILPLNLIIRQIEKRWSKKLG